MFLFFFYIPFDSRIILYHLPINGAGRTSDRMTNECCSTVASDCFG